MVLPQDPSTDAAGWTGRDAAARGRAPAGLLSVCQRVSPLRHRLLQYRGATKGGGHGRALGVARLRREGSQGITRLSF